MSIAAANFEMAVTRHKGKTFLTLRGPETRATAADCPAEGTWLGIRFRLGTFMPRLTPEELRDHHDVTLPDASGRSFWLDGSAWEYPDFDTAENFVARLVQKGIITRDPMVDAVMRHEQPRAVPSIRAAPFPSGHWAHVSRCSSDRARPIRNEPAAPGRIHPGHRLRSWIFRSAAPHPIAEASGRTDARGARSGRRSIVVSIQNRTTAMSL